MNARYHYICLAILFVIPLAIIWTNQPGHIKDDWEGFAFGLRLTTQPGDYVVAVPGYMYQPLDYYYSNATDRTIEFMATHSYQFDAIMQQQANNSVYFVVTNDIYAADPDGDAVEWLSANTVPQSNTMGIHLLKASG